jgi:hypothetical protein
MSVTELKKKHVRTWLQRHKTYNSNTQRNVIACMKAAFNFCCKFDDLDDNPIASYQKPAATARVTAFSPEEEKRRQPLSSQPTSSGFWLTSPSKSCRQAESTGQRRLFAATACHCPSSRVTWSFH